MKIEVTYELVTPMFLGGAEQQAELRLASFKGVLRYWWRALAWSQYNGDLEVIAKQESVLFGSAAAGQSRVLMRFKDAPSVTIVLAGQSLETVGRPIGAGARYLAYGPVEPGDRSATLARSCIFPPLRFSIMLDCSRAGADQLPLITGALKAIGLLAGLGARSRRGYGSMCLRSLVVDGVEQWRSPIDAGALKVCVEDLIRSRRRRGLPPYTAVSDRTRCIVVSANTERSSDVLELLGREMIRYRSKGYLVRGERRILGREEPEGNFLGDHRLVTSHNPSTHPERVAFGLPHNYGSEHSDKVGPAGELDRRASPLFVHVHRCGDGSCVGVLSLLPAKFLPGDPPRINVGGTHVEQVPEALLYRPVERFLDRFVAPSARNRPRFSVRAQEVFA